MGHPPLLAEPVYVVFAQFVKSTVPFVVSNCCQLRSVRIYCIPVFLKNVQPFVVQELLDEFNRGKKSWKLTLTPTVSSMLGGELWALEYAHTIIAATRITQRLNLSSERPARRPTRCQAYSFWMCVLFIPSIPLLLSQTLALGAQRGNTNMGSFMRCESPSRYRRAPHISDATAVALVSSSQPHPLSAHRIVINPQASQYIPSFPLADHPRPHPLAKKAGSSPGFRPDSE
jgi:hypothetical protein